MIDMMRGTSWWHKPAVQLPPGWHEYVGDVARACGLNIREAYMVALELLVALDDTAIKSRGRGLRDMAHDDPAGLARRLPTIRAELEGRRKLRKPPGA